MELVYEREAALATPDVAIIPANVVAAAKVLNSFVVMDEDAFLKRIITGLLTYF
ncbi:hypothetical protein ANSO36C_49230 [Nostoc cf. commune SO-36]|uniref:Uncharacterized protein n=1 Tax=Nostoc cf. commune SO-36 TaxID=449208 RepID=A0ABN6QA53_NOSCO|nr:hypothetical protein ANSO36C_49230 [Nostoc cf. commune SO-36]